MAGRVHAAVAVKPGTARCRASPDRLPAEETTRLYHSITRIQAAKSSSVVAAYLRVRGGEAWEGHEMQGSAVYPL